MSRGPAGWMPAAVSRRDEVPYQLVGAHLPGLASGLVDHPVELHPEAQTKHEVAGEAHLRSEHDVREDVAHLPTSAEARRLPLLWREPRGEPRQLPSLSAEHRPDGRTSRLPDDLRVIHLRYLTLRFTP